MGKLRLAIAGAGLIGRAHWKRMLASSACELAAFADPFPSTAALAAEAGVPLYPTLEAMLADERPDGVILATPNALHVSGARACIEAGVPALVEKPVGGTLDESRQLAEAAEAAGVPILVGHHRRHSGILEAACDTIASGRLGRLVAVTASATFHKPDDYFDADWRRRQGGGPILINLVHEIDNLRALVGEIVEVQAFGSHAVRGFEVEDTVAVNLRFANGALGSIAATTAAAPGFPHRVEVYGTRGGVQIEGEAVVRWETTEGPQIANTAPVPQAAGAGASPGGISTAGHTRIMGDFVEAIRAGRPPLIPDQEARRSLAAVLAVYEAAQTGRATRPG